jgi:tousled-like kinase
MLKPVVPIDRTQETPSPSKKAKISETPHSLLVGQPAATTPQVQPQSSAASSVSSSSSSAEKEKKASNSILNYVQKDASQTQTQLLMLKDLEKRLVAKEAQLSAKETQLSTLTDQLETARRALEAGDQRWERDQRRIMSQMRQLQQSLRDSLVANAKTQRADCARELVERQQRLGQIVFRRQGVEVAELFEHGPAFREINAKLAAIEVEIKLVEKLRRQVASRKRSLGKEESESTSSASLSSMLGSATNASTGASASGVMGPPPLPVHDDDDVGVPEGIDAATVAVPPLPPLASVADCIETDEIYKLRIAALRKEESAVTAEIANLEMLKMLLIRDIKRVRDEDRSSFNNYPVLGGDRYLLLRLLGKGGFSEVWEANDLVECRRVACKIHQLNAQWSEERKQSYIKHAVREYEIHRRLVHHRVVRLYDVFEIDHNSFCTVLEYCEGVDLDTYIKLSGGTVPEREARSIVMQILSALRFFSEQRPRIIHYDLKPANILVYKGAIKITDFGLSKVMETEEDESIELTSQGAGTYWYLPPECFINMPGSAPKISPKVDVWATGVIFYEMLFGKRPFGHNQSQHRILADRTILNATRVDFPPNSGNQKVSQEAKDFVARCLEHSQYHRPDVAELCEHAYIKGETKPSTKAAAKRDN